MARELLNDESLEKVVGGFLHFNYYTNVLTYTHEETGVVTTYDIYDFENAWKLNNTMHGENKHEDVIIQTLLDNGYIG